MVASMFMKHPLLFKSVLPGTLAIAVGDVLCQQLEGKEEWCAERTARMALTGAVLVTPLSHYLGNGIDRVLPKSNATTTVIAKAGLNAASTVFFIVGSFSGNNLLQGRGIDVLRAQLSERLVPTYAAGLAYWSGMNLLLFTGVLPHTLLTTCALGIGWNVQMSAALNATTPEATAALAREEARNRNDNKQMVKAGNNSKGDQLLR